MTMTETPSKGQQGTGFPLENTKGSRTRGTQCCRLLGFSFAKVSQLANSRTRNQDLRFKRRLTEVRSQDKLKPPEGERARLLCVVLFHLLLSGRLVLKAITIPSILQHVCQIKIAPAP